MKRRRTWWRCYRLRLPLPAWGAALLRAVQSGLVEPEHCAMDAASSAVADPVPAVATTLAGAFEHCFWVMEAPSACCVCLFPCRSAPLSRIQEGHSHRPHFGQLAHGSVDGAHSTVQRPPEGWATHVQGHNRQL